MQFDIERLKQIPIYEVLEVLGARYPRHRQPEGQRQFNMHCFGPSHKQDDKSPSLSIWPEKNICKCYVCSDIKGDPINVAKFAHNNSFKEACTWLHETWGIPYLDSSRTIPTKKYTPPSTPVSPPKKKIHYWSFNPNVSYQKYKMKEVLHLYESLSDNDKAILVYTFIYRYSINETNQKEKEIFYRRRKIDHKDVNKIGCLTWKNVERLEKILLKYFPVDDLIKFNILKPADAQSRAMCWKYYNPVGFAVVPGEETYCNLINSIMLRPFKKDKNIKAKEFNISFSRGNIAIPFGLNFKSLSNNKPFYITEGHIDALSLPDDKNYIAVPGVQNVKHEWIGLLKNKKCFLCFDQDEAGRLAAWGYYEVKCRDKKQIFLKKDKEKANKFYKECIANGEKPTTYANDGLKDKLEKVGATVEIINWDIKYGKDLNEVLINGHIEEVLNFSEDNSRLKSLAA